MDSGNHVRTLAGTCRRTMNGRHKGTTCQLTRLEHEERIGRTPHSRGVLVRLTVLLLVWQFRSGKREGASIMLGGCHEESGDSVSRLGCSPGSDGGYGFETRAGRSACKPRWRRQLLRATPAVFFMSAIMSQRHAATPPPTRKHHGSSSSK